MTTEENKMKKAVITSGYFNPIHIGHIEYLKLSKKGMDKLFVIVNNDIQRELKGSKKFMNQTERVTIVSEIKPVDFVFLSIDNDRTVRKTITHIYNKYHNVKTCIIRPFNVYGPGMLKNDYRVMPNFAKRLIDVKKYCLLIYCQLLK